MTKPHRGLEQEDPKRHAKTKEKCIFKQPTKRENKKYEHLTAYLSISTARELSLTLISVVGWGGRVWRTHTVSVLSMLDSPSSHLSNVLPHPVPSTVTLVSCPIPISPFFPPLLRLLLACLSELSCLSSLCRSLSYKHILLY